MSFKCEIVLSFLFQIIYGIVVWKYFIKCFFFFSFILKLMTGIEEMFSPLWHFLCAHKHTLCVSCCCGVWTVISSVSVWWAAATLSFYSCKFMDAPRHTGHMQIGRGGFLFWEECKWRERMCYFCGDALCRSRCVEEMFPDLMSLCHWCHWWQ